jgi:hypothetical protein
MSRGGHGLPKVSPGPVMPYPSRSCGGATPYNRFRGGSPTRQVTYVRLLSLWTPHAVRVWTGQVAWRGKTDDVENTNRLAT